MVGVTATCRTGTGSPPKSRSRRSPDPIRGGSPVRTVGSGTGASTGYTSVERSPPASAGPTAVTVSAAPVAAIRGPEVRAPTPVRHREMSPSAAPSRIDPAPPSAYRVTLRPSLGTT